MCVQMNDLVDSGKRRLMCVKVNSPVYCQGEWSRRLSGNRVDVFKGEWSSRLSGKRVLTCVKVNIPVVCQVTGI